MTCSHVIEPQIDVLIVGAGPTGLFAAMRLLEYGLTCRIVDRVPVSSGLPKAIALHPRTLESMPSDVAGALLSAGVPVRAITLYDSDRPVARLTTDDLPTRYPFLLHLPQSTTENILSDAVTRRGGAIERGVGLVGLDQDKGGVTARLRRAVGVEEVVRSRWLIGCDGAHSTVRNLLGIPFDEMPPRQRWIAADVQMAWSLAADEIHILGSHSGVLAAFPLPDNRHRLVIDLPTQTIMRDTSWEEFRCAVRARTLVSIHVEDPHWLATFQSRQRIARRFRVHNVFLAGDAGHIHSPAGGQGLNVGIQDAGNLAWKLVLMHCGDARETLLDTYEVERRAVATEILHLTGLLTRAATLRHPLLRRVRASVLATIASIPVTRRMALGRLSQLDLSYNSRAFEVARGLVQAQPHTGDRLPDLHPLYGPKGNACRLYDMMHPTDHTLVILVGPRPVPTLIRRLLGIVTAAKDDFGNHLLIVIVHADASVTPPPVAAQHLYTPYRVLRGYVDAGEVLLWLVRPDGVIGACGRDEHPIRAYAQCVLAGSGLV